MTALLIGGCDTQDNDSNNLLTNSELDEQIETQTNDEIDLDEINEPEKIEFISFSDIVNNPYKFENDPDQIYSLRLTKKHIISFVLVNKPKLGDVISLDIRGTSADFGIVYLRIVPNEDICRETIVRNLESDEYEYVWEIKVYFIDKQRVDYIRVWAESATLPQKVKL